MICAVAPHRFSASACLLLDQDLAKQNAKEEANIAGKMAAAAAKAGSDADFAKAQSL